MKEYDDIRLEKYIAKSDVEIIFKTLRKTIIKCNSKVEEMYKDVKNKAFLKSRKYDSGIVLVNDDLFCEKYTSLNAEINNCGRYLETILLNDKILLVFKHTISDLKKTKEKLEKGHRGVEVVVFAIDFEKAKIRVL